MRLQEHFGPQCLAQGHVDSRPRGIEPITLASPATPEPPRLHFQHCQPPKVLWRSWRVRRLRTGPQFLMAVISLPDGDEASTLKERIWAMAAGYPVHLSACQRSRLKPAMLLLSMTKGSLLRFVDGGKKKTRKPKWKWGATARRRPKTRELGVFAQWPELQPSD